MRRKRPTGWREIIAETYEESGRAIGRTIMHDHSQEQKIWNLISGLDMWPRWYLFAFATLYREENPREYSRQKANRWNRKRAAARDSGKMLVSREQAKRLNAHPKPKPPEGPENYDPKLFPHDGLDA